MFTTLYIFEMLLCSALFYALYRLLLEGRVAHSVARFYLVASTILAVSIPMLELPLYPAETVYMELPVMQLEGEVVEDSTVLTQASTPTEVAVEATDTMEVVRTVLMSIYLVVVALNLLRFVVRLISIARLRRRAELTFYEAYTMAESQQIREPFSFLRTIYLNYDYSGVEREQVIAHEESHIVHHHSTERIVMELVRCVFWFNPFVWYAGNALVQVQEWQADSDVLRKGYDVKQYRQIIFRQLFGYNPDITCGLRGKITKKRFIMMTDFKKGHRSLVRLMATLPVVVAMILAFGAVRADAVTVVNEAVLDQDVKHVVVNIITERLADDTSEVKFLVYGKSVKVEDLEPLFRAIKLQDKVDKVSIIADDDTKLGYIDKVRTAATNAGIEKIFIGEDPSFVKVEQMPTFEGGDLSTFRMWVMTQLRYPKEWVDEGLSGRVVVGFVVNKYGYIDENRFEVYQTPDTRLSDEVIRVIKLSPRWTAGMHNGEAVAVKFTIPVFFNLPTADKTSTDKTPAENAVEPIVVTRY